MLKRAAALFVVGASLAMWVGCNTTSRGGRFVYAAIPASSQINAYQEDPGSGFLTPLSGSPITAGTSVQSLAVHPSGKFVYAANGGTNDISLYTIQSGGLLNAVTPNTPTGGAVPSILAIDSAGAFLYVTNVASQTIASFSIDASSGALALVSSTSIGFSPLNMAIAPNGNFLYVTGSEGGGIPGLVEGFSASSGFLTFVPGALSAVGQTPEGLAITPNGNNLYVANSAPNNSISEFTINASGSLTPLASSPVGESYASPISVLVDPSGKYLYVANEGSSNLAGFAIASDGGLSLLSSSPFVTATQPNSLAVDPNGNYLFVGNQSSPTIQSFNLATGSGALTSVQKSGVAGTPSSIVVTPK